MNLCLRGKEKIAFNDVDPGNGFDAWRRLVVPFGPRSEAQLHRMHKNVYGPPTSRRLGDVLSDLDKWEGTLNEFYQCGGAPIPEATKVMIAMGTLPASTSSSIRLALKGIYNYASFKDTLRDNIRFL